MGTVSSRGVVEPNPSDEGHPSSDDAGFVEFFRYARPRLCRALRAHPEVTDVDDVEDVVHEAFILARHQWPSLRHYDKPEAWVVKVALRLIRRWQSRNYRRSVLSEASHRSIGDATAPPCDVATQGQELRDAIRTLPRRRAEAITLHYFFGYSVAEMADILSVDAGTVKSHLSLGRRDLKKLLRRASMPAVGDREIDDES